MNTISDFCVICMAIEDRAVEPCECDALNK